MPGRLSLGGSKPDAQQGEETGSNQTEGNLLPPVPRKEPLRPEHLVKVQNISLKGSLGRGIPNQDARGRSQDTEING